MEKRSLLLGCGNSREKKVRREHEPGWVGELTAVDMNPNCGADIVMELGNHFPSTEGMIGRPLPFMDETFDEIGAYDCLEHWGRQGDWMGWFAEMGEYHRILKRGGTMGIIVPINGDALADPGHTRFFCLSHFMFLNQQWYADSLAKGLPITDYRWFWKLNFDVLYGDSSSGHHLVVMLQKT